MAQSNQSVLYDINLKYTCIMVESHRAQQYMMVSFNFDLSKIGFLHYIRNVVRHKILGLGKTRPGYVLRISQFYQFCRYRNLIAQGFGLSAGLEAYGNNLVSLTYDMR